MTTSQIRTLFSILVALVACEFAYFSATRSEPYPAIIFPGFGKIPKSQDIVNVIVHKLVITQKEGTEKILDRSSIFKHLPKDFHQQVLKKIYEKAAKGDVSGIKDFEQAIGNAIVGENFEEGSDLSILQVELGINPKTNAIESEKILGKIKIFNL